MIEPTFTADDVAAAREQGFVDGREAALAETAEAQETALTRAAASLAERLAGMERELRAEAEERAEAMARLLLDVLAALFPVLCAAHNEAESLGLVRALLPGLARQPSVTIRAHPSFAGKLAAEVERLDLLDPGRIQVNTADSIAPGDVRLLWADGAAGREAAQIWQRVSSVLAAAGLAIPQTEPTDSTELDDAA